MLYGPVPSQKGQCCLTGDSGWLCESVCIMETGRFPPHSSLFFRKHGSQRHKLLSALSLIVYFHSEKWAGGTHSFRSGGRCAQPQDVHFRLLFLCRSGGLQSCPGCWGVICSEAAPSVCKHALAIIYLFILFKRIPLLFFVHPSMRNTHAHSKEPNSDPLPTRTRSETAAHQVTLCDFEPAMFCNFAQSAARLHITIAQANYKCPQSAPLI